MECRHIPAASFERVLSEVKARFVTGLTATPRRRDSLHPITEMQLGPVRFAVDARNQAARRSFDHRLIVRLPLRLPGSDVHPFDFVLVRLPLTARTSERPATPDDLDVHEPRLPDALDVLSFQESAADSGSPDCDVLAARRRNILVDDDVRDL